MHQDSFKSRKESKNKIAICLLKSRSNPTVYVQIADLVIVKLPRAGENVEYSAREKNVESLYYLSENRTYTI